MTSTPALTQEMRACLADLPTPSVQARKLSQVRDEVWLEAGDYALVVCGPDAAVRQKIARAIWVMLHHPEAITEFDRGDVS